MVLAFGRLAAERGDLLGILTRAHEIISEVGLETLLLKIQRDEPPADQMGKRGADHRVDERRPHQVARNVEICAEQMQGRSCGQGP